MAQQGVTEPRGQTGSPRRSLPLRGWRLVAVVEVCLGAAAVLLDLLLPTLVLLALMTVSLLVRRERLATLGVHPLAAPWRAAGQILLLTLAWTFVQLAVVMPVLEHLTGQRQDLSDFAGLRGDVGLLAALLALSWTLAAVGEELAYRGYLFTRITDVVGTRPFGIVTAVLVSSLLFGMADTEQGLIGVGVTFLDAVFFGVLRLRFRTVWAVVLADGFNNTVWSSGLLRGWSDLWPVVSAEGSVVPRSQGRRPLTLDLRAPTLRLQPPLDRCPSGAGRTTPARGEAAMADATSAANRCSRRGAVASRDRCSLAETVSRSSTSSPREPLQRPFPLHRCQCRGVGEVEGQLDP